MAEALGYVGGLIKIGAVAIAARYWPELMSVADSASPSARPVCYSHRHCRPALYAVRTAS